MEIPKDYVPRCGDTVKHGPTGEKWEVAWCDGEHLAWAGWPNGRANLSDCKVLYRCSDEQHVEAVRRWKDSVGRDGSSDRRSKILEMYGDVLGDLKRYKLYATEDIICKHFTVGLHPYELGDLVMFKEANARIEALEKELAELKKSVEVVEEA